MADDSTSASEVNSVSGSHSAAVLEALQSGLWKEKLEKKTGRKYFQNTETKKKVWNLAKELAKNPLNSQAKSPTAEGSGSFKSNAPQLPTPAERAELIKKRVDEEQTLRMSIQQLEGEKTALESEIARTKAAASREAEAVSELRRFVADKTFSIDIIEKEIAERQATKKQELQRILEIVANLQASVDAETTHKEAIDARKKEIETEAETLEQDLQKEQQVAQQLQEQSGALERQTTDAKTALAIQQNEIARTEELIFHTEAELERLVRQKNEVQSHIEKTLRETEKVKALVGEKQRKHEQNQQALKKRQEDANKKEPKDAKSSGPSDELEVLERELQRKQNLLTKLTEGPDNTDQLLGLQHSNQAIQRLVDVAKKDYQVLDSMADTLQSEITRISQVVLDCGEEADLRRRQLEETLRINRRLHNQLQKGSVDPS